MTDIFGNTSLAGPDSPKTRRQEQEQARDSELATPKAAEKPVYRPTRAFRELLPATDLAANSPRPSKVLEAKLDTNSGRAHVLSITRIGEIHYDVCDVSSRESGWIEADGDGYVETCIAASDRGGYALCMIFDAAGHDRADPRFAVRWASPWTGGKVMLWADAFGEARQSGVGAETRAGTDTPRQAVAQALAAEEHSEHADLLSLIRDIPTFEDADGNPEPLLAEECVGDDA